MLRFRAYMDTSNGCVTAIRRRGAAVQSVAAVDATTQNPDAAGIESELRIHGISEISGLFPENRK